MSRRAPFQFDISVSADKKRRAKTRGTTGAFESSAHSCEAHSCELSGKYRAPKSPNNLDEFQWFCLKHVKEYNQHWNFFENHSQEELEKQFDADKVWERPTKPFSKEKKQGEKPHGDGRAWARLGLDDPHDIFKNEKFITTNSNSNTVKRRLPPSERKALEILDAKDSMTKDQMRKIYKALVKDLHPDRNDGRRDDEDRLAEVVWAWDQIKASRSFKD